MVTKEQQNLLGRYERGLSFVNYTLRDDGLVEYSWGTVGFGERNSYSTKLSDAEATIRNLLIEGWVKTDEVPVAEFSYKGGDDLLDWVGGITR
jgi:hypothetical protein